MTCFLGPPSKRITSLLLLVLDLWGRIWVSHHEGGEGHEWRLQHVALGWATHLILHVSVGVRVLHLGGDGRSWQEVLTRGLGVGFYHPMPWQRPHIPTTHAHPGSQPTLSWSIPHVRTRLGRLQDWSIQDRSTHPVHGF